MKTLIFILVLCVGMSAQTAVDGYLNMNLASPSAPGTTLTATILNNGSTGAIGGWALAGTTANMTVGTHTAACTLAKPIGVGTTTYGTGMPSQSFSMNMASANTTATATVTGTGRVSVFSFCWTAPSGSPTNVQDILATELSTRGFELWVQWVPTNSLRLESAKDSFATSPGITLVPGSTYQIVLLDDYVNGLMKLAVFNTAPPFAQVGLTQQMNQFVDAGHVSRFFMGNGEIGTSPSTQKFENLLLDNTSNGASFPTLGVGSTVGAPLSQGIISPTRAIDWSGAGVVGGIPSAAYTQCGATMGTSSTGAQINTRLASCAASQFVQLAAGTFPISDVAVQIINKSNLALRGMGADQTFLVFTGIATTCGGGAPVGLCVRATDGNFSGGPSNTASWTAGYNDGNTNISLSAVANLKVGNYIILDQLDDTQTGCDVGGVLVSDITTTCTTGAPTAPGVNGPYSGQGNGGGARSHRAQQQIVQVTQCDGNSSAGHPCASGANVTIFPGLYMPNWSAANTPQAWWATSPSQYVGIENLSIDNTNNGQNANACSGGVGIGIYNSPNSWVSGVRDVLSVRAHVQVLYSPHVTVRSNYFYGTQNRTSCSYGVEIFSSSDTLIENNIFQAIASPYMSNGPDAGVVYDYNFSILNLYTASSLFTANAHGDHDAGNNLILVEGNAGNVINADVIHGTGNFGTYFRNRYSGLSTCWQSSIDNSTTATVIATGTFANCNNNLSPFVLNSFHRFYNLLGNIAGTTGTNTTYINTGASPVLDLGSGNSGFTPPVLSDANVQPTTLLWGNCDSANGFGACRFQSSEVPSGLANQFQQFFSNPVPTCCALPASLLYSAKPSWWPVAKVWPPIGPDVTSGNIANVGGHANTIPAQDCFLSTMGGPSNGVGAVLPFNAVSCYTAGAAPTVLLSPTSLTFAPLLVGLTSASQLLTLTNTGTATLTVNSIVASGDFAQSNDCGATVTAGAFCTITVTFAPTDQGLRAGAITVTDNASGSPHSATLSGTGIAPSIYRPTTFTDSGVNAVVNPTFAYDADLTTFATGTADDPAGTVHPYTIVYSGFPATIGTPANAAIYLYNASYNLGCSLGGEQAEYSLNGGTTWNQVWVGTTHGAQNSPLLDRVILSPGQQFSQVQVRFGFGSGGTPTGCSLVTQMYEVWIQIGAPTSTFQGGNLFQGGNVLQ